MVRGWSAVRWLALVCLVACHRSRAPAPDDARAPVGQVSVRLPPAEKPMIRVERDRVMVTTSRGTQIIPDEEGAVDAEALGALLTKLMRPPHSTIELADDASYAQLITVMGFTGRGGGLSTRGDYPRQPSRPVHEPVDLDAVPIVIVTTVEISVLSSADGQPSIHDVMTVEQAMRARGDVLPELAAELERIDPPGLAIIKADKHTAGRIVNQVVRTTRSLGIDRVLFAIKYVEAPGDPAASSGDPPEP